MTKLKMLSLAAAFLLSGSTQLLFAQTFAGSWQGSLLVPNGGPQLRCVLKVDGEDAALKGQFYSIDQSPKPIDTTEVAVTNGEFHFSIAALHATYTGTLSADQHTATGFFNQGGMKIPLTLQHVDADTAWPITGKSQALKPMDPKADASFEVETIKPTSPEERRRLITVEGRRLVVINMGLTDLLAFAYNVQPKQIVNSPDWMSRNRFDINAIPAAEGEPSETQMKAMIRKMITERFSFSYQDEDRMMPVYLLTTTKTAPKFVRSNDKSVNPDIGFQAPGRLKANNASLDDFCQLMQSVVLDRPVSNKTGLAGLWNFELSWTPDDSQFGGQIPHSSLAKVGDEFPNLFIAIQEQLGLKLEAGKSMEHVLAVTSVKMPSAN